MPTIPTRALSALLCAAALGACDGRAAHLQPTASRSLEATPAESPEAFISTEFEACGEPAGANPSPRHASAAHLSDLLHGVWVGERTVEDGSSQIPEIVPGEEPPGHYVMVFDMKSGQGMVFEERGTNVESNAFAELLPPAEEGAPAVTNFYCGGPRYSAFRDRFVKVSNHPAAGLKALEEVTGAPVGGGSIHDAFAILHEAGYFGQPREESYATMAYYDVTVTPLRTEGSEVDGVRWDMVAQYRGSASTGDGEVLTGTEGGWFEAVELTDGSVALIGGQVEVACNCIIVQTPHTLAWDETESPDTDLRYTKIVIGPFPGDAYPASAAF